MKHYTNRAAVYITMNFVRACENVDGLYQLNLALGPQIEVETQGRLLRAGIDTGQVVNPIDIIEHLAPRERAKFIEHLLSDQYVTIEEIDQDYFGRRF